MGIFLFQRCSEFLEETECICALVLSVTISSRVALGILEMGGDTSLGVKIFDKTIEFRTDCYKIVKPSKL